MAKTVDQLKYFNDNLNSNKINTIKSQIVNICKDLLDAQKMSQLDVEVHYRIDGLIFDKDKKTLIIVTDRFLIKYKYAKGNFKEKHRILIVNIDYITLTSDYNCMILHLVEAADQKNFVLKIKKIDRVVGALCSTFFYDKYNYAYPKDRVPMRKTPVILINPSFKELIDKIKYTNQFHQYKKYYNFFLDQKLKELRINTESYIYTCLHYKENGEKNFLEGDFILDIHAFYIVEYQNDKFELKVRVYLKNISKMKLNNDRHTLDIYDDEIFPNGIELKSNIYKGIMDLITTNKYDYNTNGSTKSTKQIVENKK